MLVLIPLLAFHPAGLPPGRSFAATEGYVKGPEKPFREELCLNGKWSFQPMALPPGYVRDRGEPPELASPQAGGWSNIPIKIPSPWNVNRWTVQGRGDDPHRPYQTDSVYYPSYPRKWDGVEMGWLRRSFQVPASWSSKRLRLRFEAVAGECQVYVNGKRVGQNFDSFLPFEIDVTDAIQRGRDNELRVGVRDARLWNGKGNRYTAFRAPYPPGSTLDHITGIWQDVSLLGVPAVRVENSFVQPKVGQGVLATEVTLRNETNRARTVELGGTVAPWVNLAGKDVLSAPEPRWKLGPRVLSLATKRVVVPANGSVRTSLSVNASGLKTWSPEKPNLYGLVLDVRDGGKSVDRQYTRFGWREFKVKGSNLLLNGRKITLTGDLLHPFGPFIGSRRYVWSWYRMIKDMGGNAVRPHAQPHPQAYLDLADEMGICVLDETALFGSSIQLDFESPAAWERFDDHYDRLVLRDRNHPSVFGWSCGNELFAMFFKVPEPDRTKYYDRLKTYAQRSYRLDPTRSWVSCDGDEDLRGGVPVWSRHFGLGTPVVPETSKPRMVGESGGSYYAKPAELARFNGDRAYESYRGRNEALAIDLYRNVVDMAKPRNLAFYSASETAWFGSEHLPFGYRDHTRPPNLSDGIYLPAFREGQTGVQPERLPPYCMTFNPGFDSTLPLYRPLPMFEAFKAALAGRPLTWKMESPPISPKPTASIRGVAFAGDRAGRLFRRLNGWGVPFTESASDLMVVDGDSIAGDGFPTFKSSFDRYLADGGNALIVVGGSEAETIGRLVGTPVELSSRTATGMAPVGVLPENFGLSGSSLYFAEDETDPRIVKRGLGGELVRKGRTILRASDTDWTLFNDLSEEEKCSNLLIFESLIKPAGATLVELPVGKGRIYVCSIDYASSSPGRLRLWRRLLENLGVVLGEPKSAWALPTARAAAKPQVWRYTTTPPENDWSRESFGDTLWREGEAGFGTDTPGSRPLTSWTTDDIWMRTHFSLSKEELGELKLHVYHDEDAEVYVNGVPVFSAKGHVQDYTVVPITPELRKAFREGDNVVAVHCHQTAGGQYIDVGISTGEAGGASGREYDPLRDGPKGSG